MIVWIIALCPWVMLSGVGWVFGAWLALLLSVPYIMYDDLHYDTVFTGCGRLEEEEVGFAGMVFIN